VPGFDTASLQRRDLALDAVSDSVEKALDLPRGVLEGMPRTSATFILIKKVSSIGFGDGDGPQLQ